MKYPIYTYIYFKEIFLFENCCSLFLWRKFDKIMLVYKKSCESLKSAYSDFTVALMFLLFAKERNTNLCHFWTLFISNINKAKEWRKNFYRFLAEIRNTQAYIGPCRQWILKIYVLLLHSLNLQTSIFSDLYWLFNTWISTNPFCFPR